MVATRLQGWSVVLAAGIIFAVVLGLANVVVLAGRGKPVEPCPKGSVCLPPANAAGRVGERWTSSALHYSFEYPSELDRVVDGSEGPADVHLTVPISTLRAHFDWDDAPDLHPDFWITGYPASEKNANEAFLTRLSELKKQNADLEPDSDSWAAVPVPSLGFVDAVGGSYAGSAPTPTRVTIAAVSAGSVTVVMSAKVSGEDLSSYLARFYWGAAGDLITDTFRFS